MKYEMPVLTEQQKAELIDYLSCGMDYSYQDHKRLTKLIDQIALASLTAEPFAWHNGDITEDYLSDLSSVKTGSNVMPLYAAPPITKLKVKCRHKFEPNGYGYGFKNFKCSICGKVKTERTECPE